jgi:hypothetical protein
VLLDPGAIKAAQRYAAAKRLRSGSGMCGRGDGQADRPCDERQTGPQRAVIEAGVEDGSAQSKTGMKEALYDKISREDILAHAYAQCRSNKGAPGVDGQDFADIEAYGVQRWLGQLASGRKLTKRASK